MKKTLIVISVLALFTLNIIYVVRAKNQVIIKSAHENGELVVAIDVDLPGYFVINETPYGYQYELLNDYAASLGVKLRVVSGSSVGGAFDQMRNAKIDMVATTPKHISSQTDEFVILNPEYNSTYVVLAGRKTAKKIKKNTTLHALLSPGSKIILQQGFTASKSYDRLLDSVKGTEMFVSTRNGFDLMSELNEGAIDFVVLEKLEAEMGCVMFKNIRQVHDFNEDISLVLAVDHRNDALAKHFNKWLEEYKTTDDYAVLYSLYMEKDIVKQMARNGFVTPEGGISPYDDVMREMSEGSRQDWRMLSAIAYHESRFNPYVVSRRGAKGIMQIMPAVARQFNVSAENISNPKENISVAIKLLDRIEKGLKLGRNVSEQNRMSLILACYNAGIGHVIDARRLTRKHGGDPDSWHDVSFYLVNKSSPQYYDEQLVKSGRLKGHQTLAFVNNVVNKYTAYCAKVK